MIEPDAAEQEDGVSKRIPRIVLIPVVLALAVWAAARASTAGASVTSAFALIGRLTWFEVLGLGALWMLGLVVHTTVLAASLPGLTRRRALTLNLTGSAVANVLPLGGVAGTALNLTMTRSWGHGRLDFARFVVVSNACDVIAKLVMPAVAVAALLATGVLTPATGGWWALLAGVSAAAGLLLAWALCGRVTPLLRLVAVASRVCTRLARRRDAPVGAGWPAAVAALLAGTDQLVRRHRVPLVLGMAGYWTAQAALVWCCLLVVGARPAPAVVLGALAAERLSTLLVVTPGGAGPAEAGMVSALIGLGVGATGALAGVLLFRAFVFLAEIPVGAAVGAGWWAARRRSRSDGVPPACA